MKILFINVSIRPTAQHRQLPVGLGYVVTMVEKAGIDFDILDIDIERLSDQQVEQYIQRNKYDVIAFGAIVTAYRWVKWLIHTIKLHQPGCKVVVGNSVGESIPEILFAATPVDVVVLSEGEFTMVDLLEALDAGKPLGKAADPEIAVAHHNGDLPATIKGDGIPGIVFRDPMGRLVNTGLRKAPRRIDDLPYPNWDLFDVERYIDAARLSVRGQVTKFAKEDAVVMPVNTARGCVFKCSFCHYTQWNDPYRHRSPESVIGEIRRNQKKYGANYINFWDDLTFHKLGPAEKFVDALLAADLGIHWTAAIRMDLFGRHDIPRADRVRVAEKFRDAGAVVLGYSLESANEEILKAMNKRVESKYFAEQINLLREVGDIVSSTSVVFGYPQETKETIAETMGLCRDLSVYPSPGFLLPLPATEMWRYAVSNGLISNTEEFLDTLTERQDIVINFTKMSDDELQGEVLNWLDIMNTEMELGFKKENLIKTGGINKHTKNQVEKLQVHTKLDPQLNYASVEGGI